MNMPAIAPPKLPDWLSTVCRTIEQQADQPLPLAQLAALVQLSPGHLQRRFKQALGISPRQYQEACRMQSFKQALRAGQPVTEALYAAGFGSSSRLYEKLDQQLGMTPSQYRSGGAKLELSWASAQTDLGLVLMAATDRGLCFLQFGSSESELLDGLRQEFPRAAIQPMAAAQLPLFDAWIQALQRQLRGLPGREIPLDPQGTAFQQRVWRYLQQIPCGQTRSYTEVAQALNQPKAVRAVASACARNRIAVLIPCHRVIRGDGGMGGYRWGLQRKQRLLSIEQATGDQPAPAAQASISDC